jgi:hypothetical protein
MTDADMGPVVLGHLAVPERRRVLAAMILGAVTLDEVKQATGLSTRTVVGALHRMVDSGVVVTDGEGRYWPVDDVFRRASIRSRPVRPAGGDSGDRGDTARVLRSFVRDGRLLSIPTQRAKRLVILDLLAQEFEPGRRYRERTVNTVLGKWHDDTAALRRYLVDEGFLDRAAGEYWRTGGSFGV